MIYKAIRNFRIDKLIVSVGDVYTGGQVDLLLSKGLIKREESIEPVNEGDTETLEASPTPKSKKKKKE